MTDFGRRAGDGDMKKEDYDADEDNVVDAVVAHKTSHQDGGTDEVSVQGLAGELTAAQPSTWAKVAGKPSTFTPAAHKTSHQNGGTDQIDCTGLTGAGGAGLLVDGTAGRVLRQAILSIKNGTNAETVKCALTNTWNGDAIAEVDNIAKNATTGDFTLSSDGETLTIEASGLTGNALTVQGTISLNTSDNDLTAWPAVLSNDITIKLYTSPGGTINDMTALADTGNIYVHLLYITDA